jgi:hypothetical protein
MHEWGQRGLLEIKDVCTKKVGGVTQAHPSASSTAVAPPPSPSPHTSFSVRAIGLRARDDAVLFLLLLTGRRLQDYLFSGAGDLLAGGGGLSCCE